jgi:hypothetical protein
VSVFDNEDQYSPRQTRGGTVTSPIALQKSPVKVKGYRCVAHAADLLENVQPKLRRW